MARRVLPLHIPGSLSQFRDRKRQELRAVRQLFLDGPWVAGAYCPEHERLDRIRQELNALTKAWSRRMWGR